MTRARQFFFQPKSGLRDWWLGLLEVLFGCSHKRTTFPRTRAGRTYIVCLTCGKECEYSWQEMRKKPW